MTGRRPALTLGFVASITACSAARTPSTTGRPPTATTMPGARTNTALANPPNGPVWTRIAPRDIAFPLLDVAALSGQDAIVSAADGIYRVSGHTVRRICAVDVPIEVRAVQAHNDRFIAVGGDDSAPYVWRSSDRGEHCERVLVPPIGTNARTRLPSGTTAPTPHLDFDGTTAIVWSYYGGIAASLDGGATWRRVPDLDGVLDVFPARNQVLFAAARIGLDDLRYGDAVQLYRLQHIDGGMWEPVNIAPERRLPLQATRSRDGEITVLDAVGTLALHSDGTFADDAREPALHGSHARIRIAVPAGIDRFVVATDRTLVDVGPGRFEPFASFPAATRLAIDANEEGDVWLARSDSLVRGHVGSAELDEIVAGPALHGTISALAVSRNDIAIVADSGDVALSRDGGGRWRTVHLDAIAGASDAAIDAHGNVLVVGSVRGTDPATLAVTDGDTVASVTPRSRTNESDNISTRMILQPSVHAVGERWIVVDRDVFTSDDEGAHWTARMPASANASIVSATFVGAGMFAVDAEGHVWRSDDACSSITRVATDVPRREGIEGDLPTRIAWNGARDVALIGHGRIVHSDDAGNTWRLLPHGTDVSNGFAMCLLPDRRVLARANQGGRFDAGRLAIEDRATGRLDPIADVDAHPAAAIACDPAHDAVYVVSAEGSVSRVSGRQVR